MRRLAFFTATLVIALTFVLFAPSIYSVQAATYYVDDDNCPGPGTGAMGDPFCKIQDGIDAATSSDIILVGPGVYVGGIDFGGKDLVIQSTNGPRVTTIDGNGDTGVQIGPQGSLIGFSITNSRAYFGAGISVIGTGTIIRNNIFDGNIQEGGGFGAAIGGNGASPTIEQNVFRNNTCDNQHLSGVISFVNNSSPRIVNNIIENNPCRAINMTLPTGSQPEVTNNTIVNNRVGVHVDRGVNPSLQIYRNNILVGNEIGLEIESGTEAGNPTWENNLVFDNIIDYDEILDQTGLNGNISEDPLFVDSTDGDYHLWPDSPCVDAGTSEGAPSVDFDGDLRPVDGDGDGIADVDIGADEAGLLLSHDVGVHVSPPPPMVQLKLGVDFFPQVKVKNIGTHNENNIKVNCRIELDGALVYFETYTIADLASRETHDVVFSGWAPQSEGKYDLEFYTELPGDENPANDTQIRVVNVSILDAEFLTNVTSGSCGLGVSFTDLSVGEITEWSWDFGDGNVSTVQSPVHTYTQPGTYTVSLSVSNENISDTETKSEYISVLLDIFGIAIGNDWTYQGSYLGNPYDYVEEVTEIDQSTFPSTTYVVEARENGTFVGKDWYERTPGEMKYWGFQEGAGGDFYSFSDGLVVAWFPMQVNDQKYTSATTVIMGYGFNVGMTADVVAEEAVTLGFDTLEAYKLQYQFRVWNDAIGYDDTTTWYNWVVPYLGIVKYQDDESLEELSSFSIGCGTVTLETDADSDDLKDYQELFIHETNWQDVDTDVDGMPDGWEVTYELDPLDNNDANGDIDQDGYTNLEEFQRDTDPSDPDSHPSRAMPWIPLLLLDD